jgi:hypothetical protein
LQEYLEEHVMAAEGDGSLDVGLVCDIVGVPVIRQLLPLPARSEAVGRWARAVHHWGPDVFVDWIDVREKRRVLPQHWDGIR